MDDSCRSDENEVYDNNYDNISTTGNRAISREENMSWAREDSVAPKKKKRVSKKTELENKLSSLETRFDDKFNKLSDLFQDRSSALGTNDTVISQPGGLATQQENVSVDESIGISSVKIFDKTFKLVHVDLIELSVDFELEHCPISD
jgi:hypothetical protein